jgi:hypothetical protein
MAEVAVIIAAAAATPAMSKRFESLVIESSHQTD